MPKKAASKSSPKNPPAERVYDVSYPRTRGTVLVRGEAVSEVKWDDHVPWGSFSFTMNKHLRPAE